MMLYINILLLTMFNSLLFTQLNHPLAMTLTIVLQTIMICLMTYMISSTAWFSYILFLVFLGGMLVVFIYITSLASNELFTISIQYTLMAFIFIMITIFMLTSIDSSLWNIFPQNTEMLELPHNGSIMNNETTYLLTKLYNKPTNIITILLMNYLLLTLIIVVKITDIYKGPLRPKN
uniref:NADH-ubiquinone oxidoreductase chain 6 n=1 Tax=Lipotactes tripyrga TaxID=948390 RepID=A0A1Q1MPW9_9ORTH|nr:NADH dehydrogenase subunit 6 [Lipotactes tripyrga]AQM40132.1 NADH dehydrogenase subunit 6 [Lipotactes tripyrga]